LRRALAGRPVARRRRPRRPPARRRPPGPHGRGGAPPGGRAVRLRPAGGQPGRGPGRVRMTITQAAWAGTAAFGVTAVAAGAFAPIYGLGLCGLWAARYGVFPPRPRK